MPDHIARFEVLEKIGEGGMGSVFKARDPGINRIVAIKLLREGFDSPEIRERFMQEARSAGRLQHPNIVTIFELGEFDGAPFLVMEFVVGEPLDREIKRRAPLPLIRKLELMEALCSGLGDAHRAGVIHRDIKPANLMVSTEGILKILDFGIARVGNSELTRTGLMVGTPNYMSPEQLTGQPIDKRADIFAVGAVFYELLAYQRAFPGNITEAIARILHREPDPLQQLCDRLDPQIEAMVLKALSKDPDRRYQDLGEMRRELVKVRDRLERESPQTLDGQTVMADTIVNWWGATGEAPTEAPSPETLRRATAEVEAARRQFEQGDTASAIRRLEEFEPPNPVVAEALGDLRDRADELSRQAQRLAAIARAMDASDEAFQRQDYEEAIRSADEVLLIDEHYGAARNLRRRARAAVEEQRRLAELERRVTGAIDEARQMFAGGQRDLALDRLSGFQPPATAIREALSELRAEAAAIAEREEKEARAKQADAFVAQGRELMASGRAADALAASREALRLIPAHDGALSLVAAAEAALEEARATAEHNRAAAAIVKTSEDEFRSGRRHAALEALRGFAPQHPAVAETLTKLEAELAEIEDREREEARARAAAEQRARDEVARREREAAAARERAEQERRERAEQKRTERAEQERLEQERKAATERLALSDAEKQRVERAARGEADRQAARQAKEVERQAEEEAERQAKDEAERQIREKALAGQSRTATIPIAQEALGASSSDEAIHQAAKPEVREDVPAVEPPRAKGSPWTRASLRTRATVAGAGVVLVAALAFGAFRILTPSAPRAIAPTTGLPSDARENAGKPDKNVDKFDTDGKDKDGGLATARVSGPTQAGAQKFGVTIDATPWADVQISPEPDGPGSGKGITPWLVQLPAGEYKIHFSNRLASSAVDRLLKVAPDGSYLLPPPAMPGMDVDRILREILPN